MRMNTQLKQQTWGFSGSFRAMASPCELLIATDDKQVAMQMLQLASDEAQRIEVKYSRFISANVLWQLNHAQGKSVVIDAETYQLLLFAQQCYQLSDGLFDISAGKLMRLWRFDDNAAIPMPEILNKALQSVDFKHVTFTAAELQMPAEMYLDFGGIGKEYAVDRVANMLAQRWPDISVLVNFGGDIACPVKRAGECSPWQVGIEDPQRLDHALVSLQIRQGALATSGDTRRYIELDGIRYGHIINPKTGYPVVDAPRSVTVLGPNCLTAGMLATMAMLQGEQAEDFLTEQQVQFKIYR